MRTSAECNAGRHSSCPGYYLSAHRCQCGCHYQPPLPFPPHGGVAVEVAGYAALAGAVALAFHLYRLAA